MGLKAINNSKVQYMIDALNNLEKVRMQTGCKNADNQHLQNLSENIQLKHKQYKQMLTDIEVQIEEFENLYKMIRIKFFPEMLRELKEVLAEDDVDLILLKEIIHKTYRH